MVGACVRLFFVRVWLERSVRGPLPTETGRAVETTILESTILIGNVIIAGLVRPHVRPHVRQHPASHSAARPEVVPATGRPRSGRAPVAGLDSSGRVAGHLCRTPVRPYVSLFPRGRACGTRDVGVRLPPASVLLLWSAWFVSTRTRAYMHAGLASSAPRGYACATRVPSKAILCYEGALKGNPVLRGRF